MAKNRKEPASRTTNEESMAQFKRLPTTAEAAARFDEKPVISHVALHYCNWANTRFDVDEFGRVWYPDLKGRRTRK